MNTVPIEPAEQVLNLLGQLTTIPRADIKPTDNLRADLGLDSVAAMELVSMLAEQLQIEIELEDAMQIETVGQVIELVRERTRG